MKNYSITYICFVALTISNFITAETYKIAFGSCLDQDYPQPIWQSIKKENIDSFIFLGDNVYGDIPSGNLNKMKKAYAKQKEIEEEFSSLYNNAEKLEGTSVYPTTFDPSGKSNMRWISFLFKSGDSISIECKQYEKRNR